MEVRAKHGIQETFRCGPQHWLTDGSAGGRDLGFGSKDFGFQPLPMISPLPESWSWEEGGENQFRFRRAEFDMRAFAD